MDAGERTQSAGRSSRSALAVGPLLAVVAALIAWQTWSGLDHVDRMMADRSATLQRMVATELRNVARYGAARRERIDAVLRELTGSSDVTGVLLEREDGRVRFAQGRLPQQLPTAPGRELRGATLLISGPVRIVTASCRDVTAFDAAAHAPATDGSARPACCGADPHTDEHGCAGAPAAELDGDYRVVLSLDATPYRELRRSVLMQGGFGALALLALGIGLLRHQTQMRRHAAVRQALAVADERARYLERLSLVAGGLAHEMKNPIGSMRGFAQLIAEKLPPGSSEAEYAELMVSELDSITRRVDGLRHFARPSPPKLEPGYPAEIARRVAALLGPDAAARGLELCLDLPAAPGPQACFDVDRLRELIVNLLSNALEAAPEGSCVRVRLGLDRDPRGREELRFEVADAGPGIAAADREAVLRPFYSTKTGGLGLGLALAQRAVEDHRGTLELTSGPEGGALVRARWPRFPEREG